MLDTTSDTGYFNESTESRLFTESYGCHIPDAGLIRKCKAPVRLINVFPKIDNAVLRTLMNYIYWNER
jgi:hypothetical protein